MKELIGKTITKIEIDKDNQHYICFTDSEGNAWCYHAEGDCCSESWFYHILGFSGTPVKVLNVAEVEMPNGYTYVVNHDGKSRQEEDQIYGYKLTVEGNSWQRHIDVEFRNSSNGYYGGWLSLIDAIPGTVNMQDVKEDYTA